MRGPHYLKYSIQQTPFPRESTGWYLLGISKIWAFPGSSPKRKAFSLIPGSKCVSWDHRSTSALGPPGRLLVQAWSLEGDDATGVCLGCVFPVVFHDKGWPSSADWYFPPAPFTKLFSQLSHRCPLHPHELSADLHCALCCLLNMQLCPESHNVLGLDFNNPATFTVTY